MSGACLVFEVPGLPRGKGRHRSGKTRAGRTIQYADAKTESYEAQVKWAAKQAMMSRGMTALLEGPLWMRVVSYHPPNKQQAKAMAASPRATHYCTVKPDFDNLAKVFGDSLNGLAYRDDATIAEASISKRLGIPARVVVSIGQLTDGMELCHAADA